MVDIIKNPISFNVWGNLLDTTIYAPPLVTPFTTTKGTQALEGAEIIDGISLIILKITGAP